MNVVDIMHANYILSFAKCLKLLFTTYIKNEKKINK